MDINTIRGLATLVALVAFLSVVFWAYSSRRKGDFDEAAALPFADDQQEGAENTDAPGSHRETHKNSQKRGAV
ncbi:cbb3-type cytochrome oxidase subunit 3 [Endozoicomonas sp. ALC013]|uniref:cbb3-type cytochrome oxidase subunit 3 n=1 Tax=Endozoicomonas sp. ALC013 TaxID=3403076 RepID=UPI003BB4E1D6